MSEPRAVATGSRQSPLIKSRRDLCSAIFEDGFMIRSLPLAVLTRRHFDLLGGNPVCAMNAINIRPLRGCSFRQRDSQAGAFSLVLRFHLSIFLFVLLTTPFTGVTQAQERGVRVVKNEASRRVDVFVDGQPFTAYVWPEKLKVPVLYPLRTAKGTIVTRGFPLEPRAGERVDHPHHAGFWLNYGNVNGVDFWNNSVALPPEQQQKMGTVVLRRITQATGGKDRGELGVEAEWVMPDGQPILREATTFVFRASPDLRAMNARHACAARA